MDGRFPWPAFWAAPQQQEWGWPPEDSSGSPASSPGSGSLSPSESPLCPAAPPRQSTGPRAPWRSGLGGPKCGRGARLGQGQRQSASQREKLRMRHLAKALHTLRRYLPPSVAPAGQNLTKIETLRLAIRYIGHLSELLGLSEEALARRAAPLARRCYLCPPGPGCCQPEPERPAQERQQSGPATEVCCWPSLPCGPRRPPTFLDTSSSPQEGTAGPSRPRAGATPGSLASPVTAAASWLSAAAYCSEGGNSAAHSGAGAEALLLPAELADLGLSPQGSNPLSNGLVDHRAVSEVQRMQDAGSLCHLGDPAWVGSPAHPPLSFSFQSLPGELVSFLEGLLPPASHE